MIFQQELMVIMVFKLKKLLKNSILNGMETGVEIVQVQKVYLNLKKNYYLKNKNPIQYQKKKIKKFKIDYDAIDGFLISPNGQYIGVEYIKNNGMFK